MRTYVHYDGSGLVRGVVAVNCPEGKAAMMVPKPGLFVTEIEGEVEGLKLNPLPSDLDLLRENLRKLRVPADARRGPLIQEQ